MRAFLLPALALLCANHPALPGATTPAADCRDSVALRGKLESKAPASITVSNVEFFQAPHPEGGSQVIVSYDLASANGDCTVSLQASDDGGATYAITPQTVTGDVGAGVAPGLGRQIIWRITADLPNVMIPNAMIRVVADDGACADCLYWSDDSTWAGWGISKPGDGDNVTVPHGVRLILDEDSASLGGMTIDGTLEFARMDVALTAEWIMVHGELRVGQPAQPFTHQATITLTDDDMNAHALDMGMGTRGIMVMNGGTLALHGSAPATIWTRINAHAQSGDTALTLVAPVDWNPGDEVAIAPTDFYAVADTDRRTVAGAAGNTLTLATGVSAFRWGLLQYPTASGMSLDPDDSIVLTPEMAGTPMVLDQRAEVANLTRNIVVQAPAGGVWDSNGFGVHIMVMGSGSSGYLDGVEIRRGGQRGRLGRYPFHWHMLSYAPPAALADATGQYIRNSVINQSSNRGIVVHGTNGVVVQNNVVYDVRGHAIFTEDAVERRNVFDGNVVMRVRNPAPASALMLHEFNYGAGFNTGSSGFWVSNPDNVLTNNIVADTEGFGYWFAFPMTAQSLSASVTIRPNRIAFGTFDDNASHTTRFEGLFLDGPELRWDQNPNHGGQVRMEQYQGTNAPNGIGWTEFQRFHLNRFVVWKTGLGGIWDRAILATNTEMVSADNTHRFFAGSGADGIIQRSLVVGESLNNSGGYKPTWGGDPVMSAFATYHSTFDIVHNLVLNFPLVTGSRSGVFATDDYYTRAVEKGTFRNVGNLIFNSHTGYKLGSHQLQNFPSLGMTPDDMWFTLASALWDPDGNWGPAQNYLVYDHPFLTHGLTVTEVAPGGAASGGVSVPGPFYGFSAFVLHGIGDTLPQNQDYNDLMPIHVRRLDADRNEVATWSVIGAPSADAFLGHMRDFAAHATGIYELNFPFNNRNPGFAAGLEHPTNFRMEVENLLTADDTILVGVAFDDDVAGINVRLSSPGNAFVWHTPVNSWEEIVASPGQQYWREPGQNRVWVKLRGGSWQPGGWSEFVLTQDMVLYHTYNLHITPQ